MILGAAASSFTSTSGSGPASRLQLKRDLGVSYATSTPHGLTVGAMGLGPTVVFSSGSYSRGAWLWAESVV
jgi:hypothetical protein